MTTGASKGKGVYCAQEMHLSMNYSSKKQPGGTIWRHSCLINPPSYIVAIVEVINKSSYTPTEKVHVIDDDRDLIIRYIVLFNEQSTPISRKLCASQLNLE